MFSSLCAGADGVLRFYDDDDGDDGDDDDEFKSVWSLSAWDDQPLLYVADMRFIIVIIIIIIIIILIIIIIIIITTTIISIIVTTIITGIRPQSSTSKTLLCPKVCGLGFKFYNQKLIQNLWWSIVVVLLFVLKVVCSCSCKRASWGRGRVHME